MTFQWQRKRLEQTDVDGAKRQAYLAHAEMFLLPYVTTESLMYLDHTIPELWTRESILGSSSCLVRPAHVREVPVVLYKTRHPNESHRLFTPRWKLSGGCPPGQLYEGPKVDCDQPDLPAPFRPLCTSSDRCGLKYIPVPTRLTSPRRTISHRPRAQIAGTSVLTL
jgi:hypothetical protein